MKTAVTYLRYSSDNQTEQSIEGQQRVCQEYAERNGIIIVDTYIDRAMTGTNDNRRDFQRMLRDSAKKAWDYVLVYKLDRFSRNKYEMAMHKKTLRDNGVKILSAMENIPDTPEGIILESLLEGMAEYYSAELSQKVRRGMNESRQKGNFTGGYVLYGYKIVDKKVMIDEEKAEVVRYIYEQYANGVIVTEIIDDLTARGILNRGKPFARNTVHLMLKNEKYSGVYHHNGEEFADIYPRIVPEHIFEIVQQKIKSNKYGKRSPDVVYLLREKMYCGYCGQPISAETGTSKSGIVKRYYKCSGRKRSGSCKKSVVRKDVIENLVIETTHQILDTTAAISNLADRIIEANQKRLRDQSFLSMLAKEKSATEKAISNLLAAIEQGVVTSSTKSRLEELEGRLEEIKAKIMVERAKLTVQLSKDEVVRYLKTAMKKEPKEMLELLIKRITVYDDRIEITYNYTDNKKGPDGEDRDFLLCEKSFDTPLYEIKTAKTHTQTVQVFVYF